MLKCRGYEINGLDTGLVDTLLATGYQGLFAIELDYAHPQVTDEDVAVEQSVKYLQGLQAQRR